MVLHHAAMLKPARRDKISFLEHFEILQFRFTTNPPSPAADLSREAKETGTDGNQSEKSLPHQPRESIEISTLSQF